MIFITNNQTAVVLKPGKQPLHLPPFSITPQAPAVLCSGLFPIALMRSNQINAAFFGQLLIELVAVIRSITDYFFGNMFKKTSIQCCG
jgi:hypothetical protein